MVRHPRPLRRRVIHPNVPVVLTVLQIQINAPIVRQVIDIIAIQMSVFQAQVSGVAPSVLAARFPLVVVLPAAPLVPVAPFQLALARLRVLLAPEALLRRTQAKVVAQFAPLVRAGNLSLVLVAKLRILFAPVAHPLQIVLQHRLAHRRVIANARIAIADIIWLLPVVVWLVWYVRAALRMKPGLAQLQQIDNAPRAQMRVRLAKC